MKIGLGTVQFGSDYGLSNSLGQTSLEQGKKIIDLAAKSDVQILDTAALYGNSETVLGNCLTRVHGFHIVSKTPQFKHLEKIGPVEISSLEQVFEQSLSLLRATSLYGLLIHRADDLLLPGGDQLFAAMARLKSAGRVARIGVSVYHGEQLDQLMDRFPIDLVQLPLNIFDQRMVQNGWIDKLKRAGVEVHARSAFLQGLVFMDPEILPAQFEALRPQALAFRDYQSKANLTPLQAALGYMTGIDGLDSVLCGAVTVDQFSDILDAAATTTTIEQPERFAVTNQNVINPATW